VLYPQEERKKEYDTLCCTCVHAYGDDCFALPFEDRHWVKEFYKSNKSTAARYITRCARYKKGRKPLSRG